MSRSASLLCACLCELCFTPLTEDLIITNGQMEKIRLLRQWCISCVCFLNPFVERGTTTSGDVTRTLSTYAGLHVCELAVSSPRPRHFHLSGLLAGVFLSLPLCCSQQSSCPPAGPTPTSTPPPDFKHVVLGASVMALPSIRSHRKQISPKLKMCNSPLLWYMYKPYKRNITKCPGLD